MVPLTGTRSVSIFSGRQTIFSRCSTALYPALHRLEKKGWVNAKWETAPDRNREFKYYRLTDKGKKQLVVEESQWKQMADAVARVMWPRPRRTDMRWWPRKNRDEDLARELQCDLQLEEEEQRERGLSPEDARFAAVRAFGNPTLIREQTRAVWTWNWLERLLRNLKYGVRTLWRSPSFSIVSVLVMALGIGATTSLFTIVRAVLLRPLPFRDPGRLMMLYDHFRHDERG